MEHEKRLADHDGRPYHVLKRPHTLSESGPLTQRDVAYFKKEAIWRQMRHYKAQVADLARSLEANEARCAAVLTLHLLLESWYRQVLAICGREKPESLDLEGNVEAALELRRRVLAGILKAASDDDVGQHFDIVTLEAERDAAQLLRAELEKKHAALQEQFDAVVRARDREESASLRRVQNTVKEEAEEPPEEPVKEEAVDNERLESLLVEHAQCAAALAAVEQQLKEATDKSAACEARVAELEHRLRNLGDDDLARCARFATLAEQNKVLGEKAAHAVRVKEDIVKRLADAEEKLGHLAKSINSELLEENAQLKEHVARCELDLVRVRTARDEFMGKHAVLKQQSETQNNKDVHQLNVVLHERLKGTETARVPLETFELLGRDELVKRLQVLTAEVKEIEQAFQDTRGLALDKMKEAVEHEALVKKLSVEKTKADQKYFASMRVKDALLAENKVLKTQLAKSQELVGKLNGLEKNYLDKIELLQKSARDYKQIKESLLHEVTKLHDSLKQLSKSRDMAGKEVGLLKQAVALLQQEKGTLEETVRAQRSAEARLEGKLKATEGLLQKYRQNNTSLILLEEEKQMEALRAITKCSVCSKHWKNTAITVCGHVFCSDCVQERLAARLRRCPSCNKGFSANDLLVIHL